MNRKEVIEYLAKIEDYIPISAIERELKMPANTLQKVVTENKTYQRDLPKAWVKRFKDYINLEVWKKYHTEKAKKKAAVFTGVTGSTENIVAPPDSIISQSGFEGFLPLLKKGGQTFKFEQRNLTVEDLNNLTKKLEADKPAGAEKSNFTIDTTIPPMPKKEDFKHSVDFAAAKSDWKLKYNQ